jgi:hypothetical protein
MSKQKAPAKKARKPKAAAVAWRTDRITKDVDPNTGRRVVDLPEVPGLAEADRDAIFAFEAEHLGTVKAVIRMNKRAAGTLEFPVTHRLTLAGIPKGLAKFYA